MPAKADAEHVVTLALQPIRGPVDIVDAGDLEGLAFWDLRFDSQEPAEWQRSQMPNDLDWNFRIAILHRRNVAKKIVPLRWIVVQPADDVVYRRRFHINDRLAPDHLRALYRSTEFLLHGLDGGIRRLTAVTEFLLCTWLVAGRTGAGFDDLESAHRPDLV